MAYKTEIQVKVNGVAQLKELETTLTRVNALQTRINKKAATKFVNIGRLSAETKALNGLNRELERNVQLQNKVSKGGGGGGGGRGGASPQRTGAAVGGLGGSRLQNLALGVGFPLLFGGGIGQVIGGGLGGIAGGFGGQILGAAIGGGIEDFITATAGLGQALSAINPDLERLAQAIGAVGNEEARRLELLEALDRKTEAFNAAQEELKILVGQDGVNALKEFGDSTTDLTSNFARFITILQTGLADLINDLGIFKFAAKGISDEIARQQAERSMDPRLVALREERGTVDFRARQRMSGGPSEKFAAVEREREIGKEMLEIQQQINTKRFEELQNLLAKLEDEKRLKDEKIKQLKIDREAAAQARVQNQERVTGLRVQQAGVQIQLNQLGNEQKIFGIRQQAATAGIQLEQARFNAELSTFQLQETRLRRELQALQKKGIAFNRQKQLIDQIAENQVRQAKIEFEVGKLRIRQNVEQAKAARQQVDFEVRRINLQIQMLRLKAMEEENDKRRAARLKEVNAAANQANSLTSEMIKAADRQLQVTIGIGREQEKVANNLLRGKLESIEAERVEARRAATVGALAAAAGKAADETARMNSSLSGGSGAGLVGSGPRKGRTASTSMRIDPDVEAAVKAGKPTGFRDIFELTKALDEAQRMKNRNMLARSSSYASPGTYGTRPSPASGGGTATVNVSTGPVMQFDNEKYVSIKDFESALSELSRSQAASSRSYAGRTYGGVG